MENVDKLSKGLIELSNSFGFWKMFLLVIIFLMVGSILFTIYSHYNTKKSSGLLQLIAISNQQSEILKEIKTAIEKQYSENVSTEQAEIILEQTIENSCSEINKMVRDIIDNNNIKENKKEIEERIINNVELTWNESLSRLSKFRYKTIKLSDNINHKWKDEILSNVYKNVYDIDRLKPIKIKVAERNIGICFSNLKLLAIENINKNV